MKQQTAKSKELTTVNLSADRDKCKRCEQRINDFSSTEDVRNNEDYHTTVHIHIINKSVDPHLID
jgi:hypothetical protein